MQKDDSSKCKHNVNILPAKIRKGVKTFIGSIS